MNQSVQYFAGYDPGGNGNHGFAWFSLNKGSVCKFCTKTFATAEEVLVQIEELQDLVALGSDTLTCWSTSRSGWRPADRWLWKMYPQARNSIISPNMLFGAMFINGMAVILSARQHNPKLYITETHPKVVYLAMTGKKYNFKTGSEQMTDKISHWAGTSVKVSNDHEWDAAISALIAYYGYTQKWTNNLHKRDTKYGERLVYPAGNTAYVCMD